MLSKIGPSSKLSLLVVAMSLFIMGIGVYGLSALKSLNRNTQTLYSDRVIPLQQLNAIRDGYSIGILSSLQQAKAGNLTYGEAETQVANAVQNINENWNAYIHTYLTPEEEQLARQNGALMAHANVLIERLKVVLHKQDAAALNNITQADMYEAISPVISKVNDLVNLQIKVSGQLYNNSSQVYISTSRKFYILLGATFVFAFFLDDTIQTVKFLHD